MAAEEREILFKLRIDRSGSQEEVKKMTEEAEKQEAAIKKNTAAIKAEADSIAALRARNKELTAERNATSTATEAGRQKIAALNAELDKNNKVIKDNVDAYTKQKIGIGDYQGALDKLVPGLGATVNGIRSMTAAGLTFIATPIGMVIAAIGVALGALMAYFKGSEKGQNDLNRIMLIGSTIMEKFMDILEGVGEALFNAFSNPKQALLDLVDFIKNNLINRFTALSVIMEGIVNLDFKKVANGVIQLGTGIENGIDKIQKFGEAIIATANEAVRQGNRLADLSEKIDKQERALVVERAKVSLEVSKLRAEAIKQEGDAKRETVEQAIKLEEQLADKEVALAKIRLANARAIRDTNGADKEALDAVAKATADVMAAEESRYSATLRFQKEIEKLDEEARKEQEAIEEEQRKTNEEFVKKKLKEEEDEQKRIEAEQKKNNEKYLEEQKKRAEKEVKIEEIKTGAITGLGNKLTKGRIDMQKLYGNFFKAGAAKETIINTKAAAMGVYKALASIPIVGPVLGGIAYALVMAKGLADAAGINAIAFARGGRVPLSGTRIKTGMGIPITRSNGDDLLATVKRGEVILNEKQQAKLGGARTFARIGVPGFADGGVTQETRVAASDLRTEQNLLDVANALLNQPRQILVMEEYEAKKASVDGIKNTARVIG